jgi:esterase/lipase
MDSNPNEPRQSKRLNRRGFFRGSLALGLTATALGGLATGYTAAWGGLGPAGADRQSESSDRPWYELGIIGDSIMDNQLLWYLSATWQRMADIGECLDTATRIKPDDDHSWFAAWLATADRVRQYGDGSAARGHLISAGEAYMRAANYYRAATIHYPYPGDPNLIRATRQSEVTFHQALDYLAIPAQRIEIPYEGTTLPGYFYRSPVARDKAPVLIVFEGFHAWPEETKYLADAAMKRGYHCLQFHGPGQGLPLRLQGLPFRPDWEKVVTPVVDYAIGLPGVDAERIALMGLSFGGALAPRAAAFEKRIKICIANPGVLNWSEAIYEHFAEFPGLLQLLHANPAVFDATVEEVTKHVTGARWWWKDAVWKHGSRSASEYMMQLREFNNENIVSQIECKVLVMDGTFEFATPGQAMKLYEALRSPKHYMLFTPEDTGHVHVQTGAMAVSSQRMFDWLDENI